MKKIIIIFFLLILSLINIVNAAAPASTVKIVEEEKLKDSDLNKNIAGLVLFPTAHRQDDMKGPAIDFTLTNIVGELYGKRKKTAATEYTSPILMSIVTFSAKWSLLTDTGNIPVALSAGSIFSLALDLGNKINSELDYKNYSRPSTATGLFINTSKKIINKQSRITLGYVTGGYSKIFANFAPYYYPEKADIVYLGLDLNTKKRGMYLEIIKPTETLQNPLLINMNFKFRKLPIIVFSYLTTKSGNSLLGIVNIRIPLYPPFDDAVAEKQKKKKEEDEKFEKLQRMIKEIELK